MTTVYPYRQQPLRILIVISLIFLIGLKVAAPALKVYGNFVKAILLAAEAETEKSEKEADSDFHKNKEYYGNAISNAPSFAWYTKINHICCYTIHYIPTHYLQIKTPPPNPSLQLYV